MWVTSPVNFFQIQTFSLVLLLFQGQVLLSIIGSEELALPLGGVGWVDLHGSTGIPGNQTVETGILPNKQNGTP